MALIGCDCSVDIDEGAEVSLVKVITARKEHICCECHETIKAGQKYEQATLLFDGSWMTYKTCIPCQRIRDHYCAHGFYFEMLRDQIQSCLGFDYTEIPEEDEDE